MCFCGGKTCRNQKCQSRRFRTFVSNVCDVYLCSIWSHPHWHQEIHGPARILLLTTFNSPCPTILFFFVCFCFIFSKKIKSCFSFSLPPANVFFFGFVVSLHLYIHTHIYIYHVTENTINSEINSSFSFWFCCFSIYKKKAFLYVVQKEDHVLWVC